MEKMFRISEFAALTGLSRRQLILYDQEGLLQPIYTDSSNGYRYYSVRQVDAAYTIVRLRNAKISLSDIRTYMTERSPERLIEMIDKHEMILDQQIEDLLNVKRELHLRRLRARRSLSVKPGTVTIMHVSERNLFLWPHLPEDGECRRAMPWEYFQAFYEACEEKGIPVGFPLGVFVDSEQVKARKWERATGLFCHLPVLEYPVFYARPGGIFAVASDYIKEDYPGYLYQELFSFLDENRYQICGNSYEEHLLHSLTDDQAYLVQISVPVTLKTERSFL